MRESYDAIADAFAAWRDRIEGDPRDEWRDELATRLPDRARVLELGCGDGIDARLLAERFQITGVDVSAEQIRRARAAVPEATFIEADFTELDLPPASFDAVVSFYVFNHVPRERLAPLLESIHRWLVPGGLLLAAFGTGDTEAWVGEWLGTTMFFSSFPPETNSLQLRRAGFQLLRETVIELQEPEGPAQFQWVLAAST
ncbi:MAG TPA: methyltransferase domain-containing protein [Gaiellaceae bacterium]|nr:methyltransferase domain-containing protein [Gaiellaceae bacterium]